jgi:hypothetical protein
MNWPDGQPDEKRIATEEKTVERPRVQTSCTRYPTDVVTAGEVREESFLQRADSHEKAQKGQENGQEWTFPGAPAG